MAETPYKHLTDPIEQMFPANTDHIHNTDASDKEIMDYIITGIQKTIVSGGNVPLEYKNIMDNRGGTKAYSNHWPDQIRRLLDNKEALSKKLSERYKQEDIINRIDRRAHQRAVLYRGLTTLTVGLTIMGIYAMAHFLEIPMPLMRMPG